MSTAKAIVGVIAIGMTFGGYVPYIRDTIRGKTRAHIYTWLLWGSVSLIIAFALQLTFLPTVRKSWNQPHPETLSSYITNTARFALALFALADYGIVTMLYPATWLLANGAFAVLLLVRRRALFPPKRNRSDSCQHSQQRGSLAFTRPQTRHRRRESPGHRVGHFCSALPSARPYTASLTISMSDALPNQKLSQTKS